MEQWPTLATVRDNLTHDTRACVLHTNVSLHRRSFSELSRYVQHGGFYYNRMIDTRRLSKQIEYARDDSVITACQQCYLPPGRWLPVAITQQKAWWWCSVPTFAGGSSLGDIPRSNTMNNISGERTRDVPCHPHWNARYGDVYNGTTLL